MTNTAVEAEAFAELCRKLSLNIIQALSVGATEEADQIAHSLLHQSIARKREFRHSLDMENPDRFDLSALVVDPNAPNDEADGLAYD